MAQSPTPRPKPTWRDIALGVINANVLAALLMSLTVRIPGDSVAGYYATAATVIIPLLTGFLAGATWRKLHISAGETAFYSLIITAVGIASAFFFLKEGAICLVMASPLLFTLIWGATALGILLCRPNGGNKPAAVSVVPVLLALLVYDASHSRTDDTRVVTTSVTVRATADRVYPHLVAFAPITAKPTFFMHSIGLPYPTQTVADGATVGAWRECRFSDGIRIGERITEIEPGHRVAFVVTSQPRYPEYTEHGKLLRGEMSVTNNGDGTSTLSGTSHYTLQVHPFWYFGAWSDEVIHAVHRRVFAHIAELAETPAPLPAPFAPKR